MTAAPQGPLQTEAQVRGAVAEAVARTPILDLHTHLYSPCFGDLMLYGPDHLLTYHYLIAEVHRADPSLRPEAFRALPRSAQADLIWRELFIERLPVSEACRGVVTVLQMLGVEVGPDCLPAARDLVASFTPERYVDTIFELSNVAAVVMTNDPLDDAERPVWEAGADLDPRFLPALRIDTFLLHFGEVVPRLRGWGYQVAADSSQQTRSEAQRFLSDWIGRMRPVYLAASMPPRFPVPAATPESWLTEQVIMPVCAEHGLPWAVMPGVRRQINPALEQAGDGLALADLRWVEYLCSTWPDNRFLITVLARENQHELCIMARKFANLLPFGCWWFLNNPSLIEEMTRMRLELLGLSFVPQHSDCRVLDQLLYKWAHFRPILTKVLGDKVVDAMRAGWLPSQAEIDRDVERLLAGNFKQFVGLA